MSDSLYMQRALELAALGQKHAPPNPMVGCVIVHNDRIIGEGWHERYGEHHAEVNAINNVEDKSLLSEATAYVTLEPCSHFGKTPPCAALLIHHNLKKVVICNEDPFPLVNGRGIDKLKVAGIDVEVGLLHAQGRNLNKRFFTNIEKKRPYIILKWAETADGFIAGEGGGQLQISGKLAKQLVHKWRSEEAAIMVGTNTVLSDNPQLNVRLWVGRNPVRIVIDRSLRISSEFKVLDNLQRTIIFNDLEEKTDKFNEFIKVPEGKSYLPFILEYLQKQQISSVFVEGGTGLLQSFFSAGLFDEIRIFKSKKALGSGLAAPSLPPNVRWLSSETINDDELRIFIP